MTVLDDKGRPVEVEPIAGELPRDPFQERAARGAFLQAKQSEIDGAMKAWGDELSRHYWGDVDTHPTELRARYVPTLRERIRWRWRSIRQGLARAALWLLRVEAEELCHCDY